MSNVRVRFAPSPTGYLHIGGARTALFNWLWARKHGGVFVLRIEDTDRDRSTHQSVQAIVESLRWLGLDWDEGPEVGGAHGPYFQMERLDIYRTYAEDLIGRGAAYRCYCTKEDLAHARQAHAATGDKRAFRYPGTCRDLKERRDAPYVVRLKTPQSGVTGWNDLVKGRIDVPNDAQQDVVLVRADGVPLYNFGAAIDDATMNITLVARGDDHVVNTPIQIMILEALGLPLPQFAHLPMILAPNGEKLSKRHAAVSTLDYRDKGYLPQGLLNYLARLGWSHGDDEIFSTAQLVEYFNWDHVGSTGARYDAKKFEYVQSTHLRMLSDHELASRSLPFFEAKGMYVDPASPRVQQAIATAKTRAVTLADIPELTEFFFLSPPVMDDKAARKFLTEGTAARLLQLQSVVEQVEPFTQANLESTVHAWLTEHGLALKEVAQPARVALTGRTQSPGLFEVMEILGKDETLKRLSAAQQLAVQAPPDGTLAAGGATA
jgi:glutamyl-tRNA synthetase